jgi:DNA-binding response OmpR family regulator
MRRALIVDDDECIKNLLVILIEQTGLFDVVDYAFDGNDALAFFEKYKYDLVILDIGLMSMSGVDVCIEMRKTDTEIKIVALTGYERLATECDMTVAGFNKIYIKPDGFKELMDDIKDEVF